MSKVFHYNGEDFKGEVVSTKGITLVDFFATWCGPCKMLERVFESIDSKAEVNVDIVKIDIDKESELAQKYNVEAVPTMYFVANGEVKNSLSGFIPEDKLLPKLKELAAENGK